MLNLEGGCLSGRCTALLNGGFETGDLTGWRLFPSSGGDFATTTVVTQLGSILPTEGSHMALVEVSNVDFNFFATSPFNWSTFDEVCFDVRVLGAGDRFISPDATLWEAVATCASRSGPEKPPSSSTDGGAMRRYDSP